jgi:cell shape-determining protein MreC
MNLSATKGKDNNRKNDAVDKFIQEMKEKERENQELRKEIEAVKESHRKVATVENKGGCLKSCVVF